MLAPHSKLEDDKIYASNNGAKTDGDHGLFAAEEENKDKSEV